jgi:hypothetical protein
VVVHWRGVITAGEAEVDEKIPRRPSGSRICFCPVAKVLTFTDPERVKRFGIHV